MDVHEYLDDALLKIASDPDFDMDAQAEVFKKTFQFIDEALGDQAFKRWNGTAFSGMFLMSVFEVIATGTSYNLAALEELSSEMRVQFIRDKAMNIWADPNFTRNSGAGVRGTTRLTRLLPIAMELMKP
jgi:hypothetical protein